MVFDKLLFSLGFLCTSLANLLSLKLIIAVNPLGAGGGGGPIQILLPGLLSGYKVSGAPVTTAEKSQSHLERWQLCLFDASSLTVTYTSSLIPTSCFQQTPGQGTTQS